MAANSEFIIEHGVKIDIQLKYLVFSSSGELIRTGNDELYNSSNYKYLLPEKWFNNEQDIVMLSNGLLDGGEYSINENNEIIIPINNTIPGKVTLYLSKINNNQSGNRYITLSTLFCSLVNSNINNFRLNPDMPSELVFDRTDTSWGLFFTGIKKLGYSDNVLDYILYDTKNNESPKKRDFHSYINEYGRGAVEYYGEAVYLVYDTINNLTFEKNKTDIIKCFYGNFGDYHPDSTTNVNGVYKYIPEEYEVSLKVTIIEPEGYTGKIPLRGIKTLSPRFSLDDFTNNKVTTNKFIKFVPSDASIETYLTSGDFYSDNNDLISIERLKNYKAESKSDFFNNFFKFSNDNKNLGAAKISFKWRNNPMGIGGTEYQTVYVHIGSDHEYGDSEYSDENEQSNSNLKFSQSIFNYDLSDGDLIIYQNGNYRFSKSNQIIGKMINNVEEESNYNLYLLGKTYKFTYKENKYENGEYNVYRYTIIQSSELNYLGKTNLYIDKIDGKHLSIKTTLNIYDSKFNISFKVKEFVIDRSTDKWMHSQAPYGVYLLDYINIENAESTINYSKNNIYFYIESYSPGSAVYDGNAVSISNEKIYSCTYVDGATDIIYVKYCDLVYDFMKVKIITSDPNKIYIRGMEFTNDKFELGKTYKLKDYITFIPKDCNFEYIYFKNFEVSGDLNYMKFTNHELPTNWDEFYNNFIDVEFIKTGKTRMHYIWKSIETGGGYGENIIYIKDPTIVEPEIPAPNNNSNMTNNLVVTNNVENTYYNDSHNDSDMAIVEQSKRRNLSTIRLYISKKNNYDDSIEHYIYVNTINKIHIKGLSCRFNYINDNNELKCYTHFHNVEDENFKSIIRTCKPGNEYTFYLEDISIDDTDYFNIFFSTDEDLMIEQL